MEQRYVQASGHQLLDSPRAQKGSVNICCHCCYHHCSGNCGYLPNLHLHFYKNPNFNLVINTSLLQIRVHCGKKIVPLYTVWHDFN